MTMTAVEEGAATRAPIRPRYAWTVGSSEVPATTSDLVRILLALRGVAGPDASAFLSPPFADALHDPLLLPQAGPALDRLRQAVHEREKIAIFGDYDVDGVTASALTAEALALCGGHVTVALPHREEGYGLSVAAVRRLVPPAELLLTVDNGTSARAAIAEAIGRGASVIILDHHAVQGALPAGALVVNPVLPQSRYPNRALAAVGVAWKLCAQLLAEEGREGEERFLLDLVCLGTLADSVSVVGENRALVSWGLAVLRRSRRPGLQVLAEQAGLSLAALTAEDLTFKIIPRLNAAGRLGSPELALDLIRATEVGSARKLARELELLHEERRALTENLLGEIQRTLPPDPPPVLFIHGPWPPGVLGILASRLAEEFGRPVVAVSTRGEECVASMRGEGVNVVGLVRSGEALLTRFGGHAGAAGFSFPREKLSEVAEFFETQTGVPRTAGPPLRIDCAIPFTLVSADLARRVQEFAPFGPGNERPVFLLPVVTVAESRAVGNGAHARFVVRNADASAACPAIAFRWGSRPRPVAGDILDLAAEIRFDLFRGVPRADLHVRDARSARVPVRSPMAVVAAA